MPKHPYEDLPAKAFWKTAVTSKSLFDIEDLWQPKFRIAPDRKIVTFGSCFAQHIGRALLSRGCNWYRAEAAPDSLKPANRQLFNYDFFSARTGNIYTASSLLQWVEWALGEKDAPRLVWETEGRYYDPFRPTIEPNGFASREEVLKSRDVTIRKFADCIRNAHHFVFTMGLTESWKDRSGGYEYPMCPGTAAGDFDEDRHEFVNQGFVDSYENLKSAIALMSSANPDMSFVLTVSPVPLAATKADRHVLVSTTASKSILRAVAETLCAEDARIDYFPSYEIISSPVFRGTFFEPNLRDINPAGVAYVMDHFFASQEKAFGPLYENQETVTKPLEGEEIACEEKILEAFARK